jgi:hypothetical protein
MPPPGTAPATLIVPPEYQSVKPVISLQVRRAHVSGSANGLRPDEGAGELSPGLNGRMELG